MGLLNTLKFITTHPLTRDAPVKSLFRFLKWQVRSRLFSSPVIHSFVADTKLEISRGMTGATGNIYTGLHEFEDMSFLLHLLREEDTFVDIGANIGTYTILAAGCKKAKVISIEPLPSTFSSLSKNIKLNNVIDTVTALNIGLAGTDGVLKFTNDLDTVNHVVAHTKESSDVVEVKVQTLDGIMSKVDPLLIKIDVEGFETEVINGAGATLRNDSLKAIIIELNGSGQRYGFDENKIHLAILKYGFQPYIYDPFTRSLEPRKGYGDLNTIYLRDLEFIKKRITNADNISVLGKTY